MKYSCNTAVRFLEHGMKVVDRVMNYFFNKTVNANEMQPGSCV